MNPYTNNILAAMAVILSAYPVRLISSEATSYNRTKAVSFIGRSGLIFVFTGVVYFIV